MSISTYVNSGRSATPYKLSTCLCCQLPPFPTVKQCHSTMSSEPREPLWKQVMVQSFNPNVDFFFPSTKFFQKIVWCSRFQYLESLAYVRQWVSVCRAYKKCLPLLVAASTIMVCFTMSEALSTVLYHDKCAFWHFVFLFVEYFIYWFQILQMAQKDTSLLSRFFQAEVQGMHQVTKNTTRPKITQK